MDADAAEADPDIEIIEPAQYVFTMPDNGAPLTAHVVQTLQRRLTITPTDTSNGDTDWTRLLCSAIDSNGVL